MFNYRHYCLINNHMFESLNLSSILNNLGKSNYFPKISYTKHVLTMSVTCLE